MLKTDTGRRENDLRAALTGLCGAVLLLCWGLWPVPARAVSISPDTLGNAMSLLSTSADCAGENLSRNRVVCRETLAGASRGQVAREVAEEVTGAGLRQMGRVSGRLGMRTLGAAATGAARAVGPAGKLAASWEFGHKLGDAVYEQAVAPRIEAHLQEKARAEQQKIREQGNLLRSDRALAQEYREILLERGPEDADAYLERRSRAARSPSTGPLDRLDENLERTERARRAAQAMEEDTGSYRRGSRPSPGTDAGGGETCTTTRLERMTQQCSHVDRKFKNWLDSLVYSDPVSCGAMERRLQEHIRAYDSCFRRIAARDPSFQDCDWASDMEEWRQVTANVFASYCHD